jgi:DNA-binding PadR family transcriptional regulator
MHGYEIIKTLKDGGFSMATPARIYPLLSGLKHRKFISLIEEKQGKRIRKVYALTALGKTHLRTSKERYFTGVIAEFMKDMLKG